MGGRRTPQLRVAITPRCNFRCFYCRDGGEGWSLNAEELLGRDDLGFLLRVASEVGFTHVKFTGGEPLLREDVIEVVTDAVNCEGIRDVQIVTNGSLLDRYAERLSRTGLSLLTISVDTANAERFVQMCRGELSEVLKGLATSQRCGIPTRINMVVTAVSFPDISGVMDLARATGASLKLLDLFRLEGHLANSEWHRNFVPLSRVARLLEERGGRFVGLEAAPGGVGAPLLEYRMPDGLQVVLNDSMAGGCYHPTCKSCINYPCQDALISLRVTHDGNLKRCLIRNDNLVALGPYVKGRDHTGTYTRLQESFNILVESVFQGRAWHPPVAVTSSGVVL